MSYDDPKKSFYSRTYHSSNRKCNNWIQTTISTIKSGIPHRSGPFRIRMFMNIQSLNWPKIKLRLIFDFISNAVIVIWWLMDKSKVKLFWNNLLISQKIVMKSVLYGINLKLYDSYLGSAQKNDHNRFSLWFCFPCRGRRRVLVPKRPTSRVISKSTKISISLLFSGTHRYTPNSFMYYEFIGTICKISGLIRPNKDYSNLHVSYFMIHIGSIWL